MSIVTLSGVSKTYPPTRRGDTSVKALHDINLAIPEGTVQGIIGSSGAGKSTLVRLINALEAPTEGSITVLGQEITGRSERELRYLRAGIGMIFQQFNLFSSRTVAGNVGYPLVVAGVDKAERKRRVAELLDFVGLSDKARAHPEALSGGQKQRVGIARALATSPRILLADEATSALDPDTTVEVLDLLKNVNRDLGITIVVITHEMEVIKRIATRVAVMEAGTIVEEGEVYPVFSNPQTDIAKRFVATVINGAPEGENLEALRRRYDGSFLVVPLSEDGKEQAAVLAAFRENGVTGELVHGGIDDIQGRTFGRLTYAITGSEDSVAAAIAQARTQVPAAEVL